MTSRGWWAFERGALWARDLGGEPIPPISPRIPAVCGEYGQLPLEPLAQIMGVEGVDVLARRFSEDKRCFAAWLSDRLVAYCWVSQGLEWIGEMQRAIRMDAGEAYIWNCATLPRFRRQRLYTALLSFSLSALQGEGFRRVWIGSNLDNRPSMRGFQNASFTPVIRLDYLRLGKLRGVWVRAFPGAPEALVTAARRALISPGERRVGPLLFSLSTADGSPST